MSDDEFTRERGKENARVSDGGESLLSRVFGALAHPRRRYVLYYLRDHGQAQTDDLARQIAAWERDVPRDEVPEDVAEQVSLELLHSHLPKLEDQGLVEYDPRTETVNYAYPPSLLDEALDLAVLIEGPP